MIQASELHGCKFPGSPCHTWAKTDGNIIMGRFDGLFIAPYNNNNNNNKNNNNNNNDSGSEKNEISFRH